MSVSDLDAEDLKQGAICADCIGESYLRGLVEKNGTNRICRYCEEEGLTITLEEMAAEVSGAFSRHYTRTATDMDGYEWQLHKDPESDYTWERSGEPTCDAIAYAAEIEEDPAKDIQIILDDKHCDRHSAEVGEETEFSEDAHYEQITPSDMEWQAGWRSFEKTVKSEARFFSRIAAQQLGALFDDIDTMRTRTGCRLIIEAGPKSDLTHIFRARAFQSSASLLKALERPDRDLSSPPSALASSGRMNAAGISVFYGATESQIAIAEIRPPVGAQVAVARFDIIRSVRLLDLTALKDVHETGSIFDPSYAIRLSRVVFLQGLCERISRPVMPDEQTFEYLPTQAVADYLATEAKTPLDGIIYPSVQAGNQGLNVVLFHKAARCEELSIPAGTEFNASDGMHTEDGWEPWYSVTEKIPPPVETDDKPFRPFHGIDSTWDDNVDSDSRELTFRLAVKSVEVHVIKSVTFTATSHVVSRYRPPPKLPF